MKTMTIWMLAVCLFVGMLALSPQVQAMLSPLLAAYTLAANTNPPAYIKDVVAYKEGDGLVIYLTLADATGALTSADGTLNVTIREPGLPMGLTVWTQSSTVTRTQFQTAQVGQGAFARTVLLFSLGRIREQDLLRTRHTNPLTVEVSFATGSQRFTGASTVWL